MSEVRINTRIVRNYGAYSIEFEISREIEAETRGHIYEEYNKQIDVLEAQIVDFEANRLPRLPVPQNTRSIANDLKGGQGPKWYPARDMTMSVKDGKAFFYIRPNDCPQYAKFGAAVYFDRFKGLTEKEARDMMGQGFSHTFDDGMMVLIEVYQGKPKAIQIAHKDTIGEG